MIQIHKSWFPILKSEFNSTYFIRLIEFVNQEYDNYRCYPPKKLIFNAFEACPFYNTKVVILGQDPYHGPNQANGLCFSVHEKVKHPPSLVNIFKELKSDIGIEIPISGDLTKWSTQGVLLLNATLTVRENQAGSHQKKGWEQFTNQVIQQLSLHKNNLVFLLWGGYAQQKKSLMDNEKHTILCSGHPSPLSANRGYWFGNNHFSKTNFLLEQAHLSPIDWSL